MNKLIYLWIATMTMLLGTSCEGIIDEPVHNNTEYPQSSEFLTQKEVITIANQAAIDISSPSSRTSIRIVKPTSLQILGSNDSRHDNKDSLIYAIDYEDNNGFALISAKRIENPILAVIDHGSYEDAIAENNQIFNEFVQKSKRYISVNDGINKIDTTFRKQYLYNEFKTVIVDKRIEPRTDNLLWGQLYPENIECENEYAGCGPVSIAISMAYTETPTSIKITYDKSNRILDLDWDQLKLHQTSMNCYTDDCPHSVHTSIGILCREIGKRAGAKYEVDRTGTTNGNIATTAKSLMGSTIVPQGFSNYERASFRNMCNNGIAIVTGSSTDDSGGHAWIGDGYYYNITNYKIYRYTDDTIFIDDNDYGELIYDSTTTTFLIHFNWGQRGKYNGYYNGAVSEYEMTDGFIYNNLKIMAIRHPQY